MSNNLGKGTIGIHGGYSPKSGEPRVLPIYQSATYKYDDPDTLEALFALKAEGHLYSRISNPTVGALEDKYTKLEGGVGAVATASGQSAILYAVLNLCKAGDHIISVTSLYGGTVNLFNVHLKNLDFDKFSSVAKKIQVPLIIDNTVATPYHCNPFEHGANIVVHSTTKYSEGHAQTIGGIVVDGGNFDWTNGKFNDFTTPDPSYHGLKYVESFGQAAYIVKLRVTLLRDLGACMSPFNAYLTNLGLETLHLRMERHSKNALEIAQWLTTEEKVSWVNYPLLEGSKYYDLAKKYLKGGASGLLTFGVKGGIENAKEFSRGLNVIALAVTLGDARSCLLHPATTSHSQLNEEELLASGVTPDLLRLSVGIEDAKDLINDISEALKAI